MRPARFLRFACLCGALLGAGAGRADEPAPQAAEAAPASVSRDDEAAPAKGAGWNGNVEVKRYATDRGTADETTQTSLRLEAYLPTFVDLIRVDIPFPDAETDFWGSPFDPRLGDVKVRVRSRAFPLAGTPVTTFVETTFPTANPESLGSGKYQLSAGLRTYGRLFPHGATVLEKRLSFSAQVQQVVSVAGDPDRKEIDNTKLDFGLFYAATRRTTLKLGFKPTIDWVQDGKTGAVLEVEARYRTPKGFMAWLKGGGRLWGEGVPGTYDARVEIGVGQRF